MEGVNPAVALSEMESCPECSALKTKLSDARRNRDVANDLAKGTADPKPDALVEKRAVNVQTADEEYASAKVEAEHHERQTGHKLDRGPATQM